MIEFEIIGLPAPQGSKTAISRGGKAHVIDGSSATGRAKHKSWRDSVTATARDVADTEHGAPFKGPLRIDVTFRMPRPRSRPKSHHGWHSVKPDKDKLLRSLFDGLEVGGLIANDSQICAGSWEAVEVDGWNGAVVRLTEIEGVS